MLRTRNDAYTPYNILIRVPLEFVPVFSSGLVREWTEYVVKIVQTLSKYPRITWGRGAGTSLGCSQAFRQPRQPNRNQVIGPPAFYQVWTIAIGSIIVYHPVKKLYRVVLFLFLSWHVQAGCYRLRGEPSSCKRSVNNALHRSRRNLASMLNPAPRQD